MMDNPHMEQYCTHKKDCRFTRGAVSDVTIVCTCVLVEGRYSRRRQAHVSADAWVHAHRHTWCTDVRACGVTNRASGTSREEVPPADNGYSKVYPPFIFLISIHIIVHTGLRLQCNAEMMLIYSSYFKQGYNKVYTPLIFIMPIYVFVHTGLRLQCNAEMMLLYSNYFKQGYNKVYTPFIFLISIHINVHTGVRLQCNAEMMLLYSIYFKQGYSKVYTQFIFLISIHINVHTGVRLQCNAEMMLL
ncbi:hypothetical protein J6590_005166 [Homalodisca vitripennis]|nr:hypothetical protein J6590_005166 [Homalodisca vitripennis]